MDLLSTVRKTGSRGGVNFSWDEVKNSAHRENYLGHSLKAPVGRWQTGRDLNWYARSEPTAANENETEEERQARERREELKRVKEAEEDAMSRALGLPVAPRDSTGANATEVVGSRMRKDGEEAQVESDGPAKLEDDKREGRERRHRSERHHRKRYRSRSRERRPERSSQSDNAPGRKSRYDDDRRRSRSRDRHARDDRPRRNRSRSRSRDRRDRYRRRSRSRDHGRRRSRERRRSMSPP